MIPIPKQTPVFLAGLCWNNDVVLMFILPQKKKEIVEYLSGQIQ